MASYARYDHTERVELVGVSLGLRGLTAGVVVDHRVFGLVHSYTTALQTLLTGAVTLVQLVVKDVVGHKRKAGLVKFSMWLARSMVMIKKPVKKQSLSSFSDETAMNTAETILTIGLVGTCSAACHTSGWPNRHRGVRGLRSS